jgi:uncharacterized membrane protein
MSVLAFIGLVVLALAAYAAYQLVKAKKDVTVASVVAQAKTDVKSEVKKS